MVRVRFAPSPTGHLHVGNIRTALFNWLFARCHKGAFILRVEDTDVQRSERAYEKSIIEDLRWLGMEWDEGIEIGGEYGPYRQTERLEIYRSRAELLLGEEKAYYCFCTPEELEAERKAQLARGEMPKYSGRCRNIPLKEVRERLRRGEAAAVRLKVRGGRVGFDDIIFGRIEMDTGLISDPVLLRSDATPNYNFAAVLDDHLMLISHVIRGEGHIPNTHRQILIYEACGWQPPLFAHLPTVLGKDGGKLSKRHGALSIGEFRRMGYLPEALLNYLALLGWSSPDGKELLAVGELIESFSLERVHKSPAIFDLDKLNWMNRAYIRAADLARLVALCRPYLVQAGLIYQRPDPAVDKWLELVIDSVRSHLDRLEQVGQASRIIFEFNPETITGDPGAADILDSERAQRVLSAFYDEIKGFDQMSLEQYKAATARIKEKTGAKGKELFHPIRVALTARSAGPELDRLVPIYEAGKALDLPVGIKGCSERVAEVLEFIARFQKSRKS